MSRTFIAATANEPVLNVSSGHWTGRACLAAAAAKSDLGKPIERLVHCFLLLLLEVQLVVQQLPSYNYLGTGFRCNQHRLPPSTTLACVHQGRRRVIEEWSAEPSVLALRCVAVVVDPD